MIETIATLHTGHGAKYIAQLCKHFAHKIEVSHADNHGECRFVCGTAVMDADADTMQIRAIASDENNVLQTQQVIESHLMRFAFREELKPLEWLRSTTHDGRNTSSAN